MEQLLEKLFESVPKIRVIRVFVRNPDSSFQCAEIQEKTQLKRATARAEIKKLLNIGLIRESVVRIETGQKRKGRQGFRKATVYQADKQFPLFTELRDLIAKAAVSEPNKLFRRIKGIGRVRLAVISGVFLGNDNSRTDLLIVGDGINKRKLQSFLTDTESELGKAIHHTVMESDEFQYRMDMYDRFLRDILEYPHEKLIDKFNL